VRRRPAVFLDRDGVLTKERGVISMPDEIELFSYVPECIEKIHRKGFLAFVITNQSGISRGLFTESELLEIHKDIIRKTGIEAIYYCPHHTQGKIARYKILCDCRKPSIGLIKKACSEFDIDMGHSYMVGDRACDILTGMNAGIRTVLLESGYGSKKLELDVKPDYILDDLREFAEFL
jgi:histidinol-phosphate phosphatase family domain/HAD-superfamily hydrolase, subfamily IIIA